MALYDSFPYTNMHELNLDWIIKTIRSYDAIIEEFRDFMETWEGEKNELLQEMHRIEVQLNNVLIDFNSRFETFTSAINREMLVFKAGVSSELAQQRVDYSEKIQTLDDYTQAELQSYYNQYLNDFGEFAQSVITYCDNLRQTITDSITIMRSEYQMADELVMIMVNTRLNRFIEELENLYPPVYNPVAGYQTTLQQALDDLYNMMSYYEGWTCRQWDNLSYTAAELDALDISAYEHDTQASNLDIRNNWCNCVMFSPFNGEVTLLTDVINEIVDTYRTNTLTAAEFDAKDLTTTYLDALDLTAHELDFNSTLLVA